MAVAVIGGLPGGNAAMDAELAKELGIGPDSPPKGSIVRFAGQDGDTYRIFSVWESREAWDAFARDQLGPIFAKRGGQVPPVQIIDLDTVMISK